MAINKNFVIKNGLEVNTDLLVADFDSKAVGVATTGINNTLQVKGGIGVTNLDVTGIATITNLSVTGVSTFVGLATFGPVGIADSIFHDGDTNTAIRFPEADTFTIETAGSEVVRVTSAGNVGVGTIDPVSADITSALSNNTKVLAVGIVTADQVFSSGIELVNGSLTLTGLTEDRIPIVGAGSTLEDDGNLTFDGAQLVVGVGATIGGGLTASSVRVEDLTDNRVVIAGADGELEDDSSFTFDGNQLVLGVGATVGGGLTASSVMVEDLTNDRVVIAGVDGELEDSANLTFNGAELFVDGDINSTGVITATTFSGSAQIGVGSEHTFIGAGITQINFASTNGTAIAVDVPPVTATGIATATITPGVSLGLAIALGG